MYMQQYMTAVHPLCARSRFKEGLQLFALLAPASALNHPLLDVTVHPYRALVGTLNYIWRALRAQILHMPRTSLRGSQMHRVRHTGRLLLTCLLYLKGTISFWHCAWAQALVCMDSADQTVLCAAPHSSWAYADSNHGGGGGTTRSVGGGVVQVLGGSVHWSSQQPAPDLHQFHGVRVSCA